MIVLEPLVYVPNTEIDRSKVTKLERYGRICYKSEHKVSETSAGSFVESIVRSGHESVIEHEKATVLIRVDRGVSHELVRHRIGSYSQESTRYCNYAAARFGREITVIRPFYLVPNTTAFVAWERACQASETSYLNMVDVGKSPQEARSVLPNSLKTEIVVTYNFREWRHFFKLRCSAAAHPQMRQVAIPLLLAFRERLPELFFDISFDDSFAPHNYARVVMTDDYFNPRPVSL